MGQHMHMEDLRRSGMIVTGALIVGALVLAFWPEPKPAPRPEDVPPTGAPVMFVVRFGETHALARAQDLARSGDLAAGRRLAERELGSRNTPLKGLCFDRFTLTGEEIVLVPCATPAIEDMERVRATWSARLEGMAGIDYAEANVILRTQPPAEESGAP